MCIFYRVGNNGERKTKKSMSKVLHHTHTYKNVLICYAFLVLVSKPCIRFFKRLPDVSRPKSGSRMLSHFPLSFHSLRNRGTHALKNTHAVCIYKCCTRQAGHFIIADSELLLPDRNSLNQSRQHKNRISQSARKSCFETLHLLKMS